MIATDYCVKCGVFIAPAASDRRKVTSVSDGALLGVVHDGRCTNEYIAKMKKGVQVGPTPRPLVFGRVIPAMA